MSTRPTMIGEVRGRAAREHGAWPMVAARGAMVTGAAGTVARAVRQALEDGVWGAVGSPAWSDDRGARRSALRYLRKERRALVANSCPGRRLGLLSRLRRPRSAT